MNTIALNNDIQMPILGFDTFLMDGAECAENVLTTLHSGNRMIYTAENYGAWVNEELAGKSLDTLRHKVTITAKLYLYSRKTV